MARGRDVETGEFIGESRSQQRRDALDVLALAETLTGLSDGQLAKLPVPEDVLPHIRDAQRITSHIARKRQIAFLAKQMRREDDETLDAIRDAMDASSEGSKRQVALMHRAEAWRTRLIEGGDEALTAFIAETPNADAQNLRQLARNARSELAANKPPRAFRLLYKEILALQTELELAGRDEIEHDGEDDAA